MRPDNPSSSNTSHNVESIMRYETRSDQVYNLIFYLGLPWMPDTDNKIYQIEYINPLFLLTAKPVVYLINLSEKDYIRKKNKHLGRIMEWIKENAAGDP